MVRVVRVHIVARVAVVRRVGGGRGVARRRATQGPLPGMGVWEFLSIWFLFLFKFYDFTWNTTNNTVKRNFRRFARTSGTFQGTLQRFIVIKKCTNYFTITTFLSLIIGGGGDSTED